MKKGLHPKKYVATITDASCGETFEAISTRESITVEISSASHPLWTGKKRVVDSTGRVERFKQRAAKGGQYGKKKKSN